LIHDRRLIVDHIEGRGADEIGVEIDRTGAAVVGQRFVESQRAGAIDVRRTGDGDGVRRAVGLELQRSAIEVDDGIGGETSAVALELKTGTRRDVERHCVIDVGHPAGATLKQHHRIPDIDGPVTDRVTGSNVIAPFPVVVRTFPPRLKATAAAPALKERSSPLLKPAGELLLLEFVMFQV
jgi:hypothetical protein